MKNILYIGGFDLPDKNAAAQRVISNSKAFRKIGYNVFLLGLGKVSEIFEFDGFKCKNRQYPQNLLQWFEYLFSIRCIKHFIKGYNPQVIVAYNYPAFALFFLIKYCKKNNIKIIADCTEWYNVKGCSVTSLIKRIDVKIRMSMVHPQLNGVICISRFLYNYYIGKVNSILLPPLVDLEENKWKEINCRKDTRFKFIYSGSPGQKDRLDIIIKAIRQINIDFNFVIIGISKDEYIKLYNDYEYIPSSIVFKGRMTHKDALKELLTSDCQIFIRTDNIATRAGFPTKFVESISSGIPVLTNLTSNLGDYLVNGNNGFVLETSSIDEIINTIKQILQMPYSDICNIKSSINRYTFDYHNYITEIQFFLDTI